MTYEADIRWTTHGVAHIRAGDWGGLGYGQGWAIAGDHLSTLPIVIRDRPGITTGDLEDELETGRGKSRLTPLLKRAVKDGLIRREDGPNNAKFHFLEDHAEVPEAGEKA